MGARQKSGVLTRLILLVYLALAIVMVLFSLSVLRLPPAEVVNTDPKGASYRGIQDGVSGNYIGPVVINFADGDTYSGEIAASGFSGDAVYRGASGWTLSGNFEAGYLNGEGSYNDSLGSYQGSFLQSIPNGRGKYVAAMGWSYEGDFLAGAVTGEGILTLSDGTVLQGPFNNGVFMGEE